MRTRVRPDRAGQMSGREVNPMMDVLFEGEYCF